MPSLINTALSGLRAAQTALQVTGHNITNANTEGYSRQRANTVTMDPTYTGSGYVGNGAYVDNIQRQVSDFIERSIHSSASNYGADSAFLSQAEQLDSLLASSSTGLSSSLENFFSALSTAAEDPQSLPSRQLVLSSAQGLADRFNLLSSRINQQNETINSQVDTIVGEINELATSIARLNEAIQVDAANGASPNDLLDQRDAAVKRMTELADVTVEPQDDGTVNITIGRGQSLVVGNTYVEVGTVPSYEDQNTRDVVIASNGVPFTDFIRGGELGGLLDYQQSVLAPATNELGRVSLVVADNFNALQGQGIDLQGNFGANIFSDINDSQVSLDRVYYDVNNAGDANFTVAISDSTQLSTSDYRMDYDGANYTITRESDGATMYTGGLPTSLDGFDIAQVAGTSVAGDSYLISPVRRASEEISLELQLPESLAFAAPMRSEAPLTNRGSLEFTQANVLTRLANDPNTATPNNELQDFVATFADPDGLDISFGAVGNPQTFAVTSTNANVGAITAAPATITPGQNNTIVLTVNGAGAYAGISFDVEVDIQGRPELNDSMNINFNGDGIADNRNLLDMVALQTDSLMSSVPPQPPAFTAVTPNQNFGDAYGQTVEKIASTTAQKKIDSAASEGIFNSAVNDRLSLSGVNLDEEASDLIRFEQAYNASAQVVSVARQLFDRILQI